MSIDPRDTPAALPARSAQRAIIFAFHGYPSQIHRLAYRRTNDRNHIRAHGDDMPEIRGGPWPY